MSGDGPRRGLKSYLGTLVATLLFPLLWMQALRMARRHTDVDPRGPAKVVVAIAVSLGILLIGVVAILGIQARAVDGMYQSVDERLKVASGESEYQESLQAISTADIAIPIIEANLAKETDPAKRAQLEQALNDTRKTRTDAQANVAKLEPNHAIYADLEQAAADHDDARIRELAATLPDYPADSEQDTAIALGVKDRAVDDMQRFSWLFLWPSLAGAFFAPLAFALGSILKAAFVPSDTVGFKPYPGAAAGWFLLFGAFGVPSIPFAAWTFHDAFGRSEEGQIAL